MAVAIAGEFVPYPGGWPNCSLSLTVSLCDLIERSLQVVALAKRLCPVDRAGLGARQFGIAAAPSACSLVGSDVEYALYVAARSRAAVYPKRPAVLYWEGAGVRWRWSSLAEGRPFLELALQGSDVAA